LLTVKVNCMKDVALAATNWNPESTTEPSAFVKFVQGDANVDWVTVWFFDRNWNETLSPVAAVIELGVKVRAPLSPTLTT